MDETERAVVSSSNLLAVGRPAEAIAVIEKGLASDPSNATLLVLLSDAHLQLDDASAAADAADRALSTEMSTRTLQAGSRADRFAGRNARALERIDRAIAMAPDQAHLHVSRVFALVHPLHDLPDSLDAAQANQRNTALAEAAAAADTALRLAPDSAQVRYARAVVAAMAHDLPTAALDLTAAIELEPDWPEAHLLLGSVRAQQGMARLASRHFAAAGQLDPTNDRPLTSLRELGKAPRASFVSALPLVVVCTLAVSPLGWTAVVVTAIVLSALSLAWAHGRHRRLVDAEAPHLAPEAQAILRADQRLHGKRWRPQP